MKAAIRVFAAVLLLVLCCAIVVYWSSCPLPPDSPPVKVVIEPGASTRDIADTLYNAGVIKSPFLFRVASRALKADGKMKAGEFSFEPGIFVWDAVSILVEGRVVYYPLTVREGTRVEDIAALIEAEGFGDRERFLELAKNPEWVAEFASPEELAETIYPVEGYLFPDTYNISKGMSEEQIISMMIQRFCQVFNQELRDKASQMGLTVHEVSTLAALVEKEAMVAEERPLIAAVYLNRIKLGMHLGACPTVLYALGRSSGTVLLKELEAESPYNTYKYTGLPPGPVSNFGKASLEAVLNPADVDYLYFVSKNDGTHAFARTLDEHNRNVALYQGN